MDFICLCPYRKGGELCREDISITEPSFSGSAHSFSPYLEYELPVDASESIEFRMTFRTDQLSQTSLLAFLGQRDGVGPMPDFMALVLSVGRLFLYVNLGSGTRELCSPRALDARLGVHSVVFGHHRRFVWLAVDQQPRAVGLTEGPLTSLNVHPSLFVGGHVSQALRGLPEMGTWPLGGFVGCIPTVEVRGCANDAFAPLTRVLRGRNVYQCQQTPLIECGVADPCAATGYNYSCPCADARIPTGLKHGRSDCQTRSASKHCKLSGYNLIQPMFLAGDSFLTLVTPVMRSKASIEIRLKASAPDGWILHTSHRQPRRPRSAPDRLSMYLRRGRVRLVYNLGTGTDTVLDSSTPIVLNNWVKVTAERVGRTARLTVANETTSAESPTGMVALDTDTVLFLGAPVGTSFFARDAGNISSFIGCIGALTINGRRIDFSSDVTGGHKIKECD
ncbi:protein eyes shut homolog [Haemaphysalis longicornis]